MSRTERQVIDNLKGRYELALAQYKKDPTRKNKKWVDKRERAYITALHQGTKWRKEKTIIYRKAKSEGHTRETLALETGLSQGNIGLLMSGGKGRTILNTSVKRACILRKALNCTVYDLMEEDDKKEFGDLLK